MQKITRRKRLAKIAECWAVYKAEHLAHIRDPQRAEIAWEKLSPTFGKLRPTSHLVTTAAAVWIMDATQNGVSADTINRDLGVLRAMLRWCAHPSRKLIGEPPYIGSAEKGKPAPRVLTLGEIRRLLQVSRLNWVIEAFIKIALLTGQRRQAILDLTWDRIDFKRNTVDFNEPGEHAAHRMKGRTYMPMNHDLRRVLMALRLKAKSDYVLHKNGSSIIYINREFNQIVRLAGLGNDVTPHTLRHTVATHLLNKKVGLLQVSRLLGHKDSRTTERIYFHYTPEFLGDAVQQLTLRTDEGVHKKANRRGTEVHSRT